jgi:hypothetical protein
MGDKSTKMWRFLGNFTVISQMKDLVNRLMFHETLLFQIDKNVAHAPDTC